MSERANTGASAVVVDSGEVAGEGANTDVTSGLDAVVEGAEIEEIDTSRDRASSAGTPFGKYQLLRRLAFGGMAEIQLAALEGPSGFSKKLIIKRILPQYAEEKDFVRMFTREARVAALISHPNIVQVYEFGEVEGTHFLAMELVEGLTLAKVMRSSGQPGVELGAEIATYVGVAAADALHQVHEVVSPDGKFLGLVHRDISPGNILLSKEGVVKLTDFGIVKLTEEPRATQVGTIKGKAGYMSPEQATAKPIDRRSDVFSLGIVLYELATGRRLFKRSDAVQSIVAVVTHDIPSPSTIVPNFPPDLELVLSRALARDPSERYPTAGALHEDLERVAIAHGWHNSRRSLARLAASTMQAVGRTTGEAALADSEVGSSSDSMDSIEPVSATNADDEGDEPLYLVLGVAAAVVVSIFLWWFLLS